MVDDLSADVRTDQDWFSVRCIFRSDAGTPPWYEERITLWRAASFDAAIALAEAEAAEYADQVGIVYLGLAQAYQLADELGHGAEVYSLIRDSELPPDDYLTAFFDTGGEHQGTIDGATPAQEVQQLGTATDQATRLHERPEATA